MASKNKIVILGAGGHAKVLIDIIEKQNLYEVAALVVHPDHKSSTEIMGYPVLKKIPKSINMGIIAIGDNWLRSQVQKSILKENKKFRFIAAIHPSASIGRGVEIGAGTVLMAGACINADSKVGNHVIINTNSVVEHDCVLGDYSSIGPSASLGGACKLGKFSALGIGAVSIHGITMGDSVVVGAGSVVTKDISAQNIAYGNPCRIIRKREVDEPYL